MRKIITGIAFMLLVGTLLLGCSQEKNVSGNTETGSNDSQDLKPITLNAVSFLPKNHPLTATLNDWIKAVEETTDGKVKVNWRGGADVIPISEQFAALNSGVIDINFTYIGQYQSQAPEMLSIALSQLSPWEERENGFYDFMVERHKEINTMYIGRWLTGSPRIWLTEPVQSIDDLKDMDIRSAPNYNRFFEALGINSKLIDPAEVYTSLQTGVVDGFVYGGLMGPRKDGWTDSAKYVLDHPFWTQNCTILMNLEKWNEIPAEAQEAIISATAEYEHDMVEYYENLDKKEREELKEIGVEFITFNEEDKKAFLDLAYDTEWNFIEKETPDLVDELRKLTTKNEN